VGRTCGVLINLVGKADAAGAAVVRANGMGCGFVTVGRGFGTCTPTTTDREYRREVLGCGPKWIIAWAAFLEDVGSGAKRQILLISPPGAKWQHTEQRQPRRRPGSWAPNHDAAASSTEAGCAWDTGSSASPDQDRRLAATSAGDTAPKHMLATVMHVLFDTARRYALDRSDRLATWRCPVTSGTPIRELF